MKPAKLITRLTLALSVSLIGPFLSSIQAEPSSEKAIVRTLKGAAHYSAQEGIWIPLKAKTSLKQGTQIKTAPESAVELQWEKSGGVLRVNADSIVELAKLNVTETPLECIAETDVALLRGSVVGSQKKGPSNSRSKITFENGYALVDGSDYEAKADGSLSVFSGAVSLTTPSDQQKISAGQSFSPEKGTQAIAPTTSSADLPKLALVTPVETSQLRERPVSPNGNNGVGNGSDPAPPGNPPENDGGGTGPGNPGNGRPVRP